MCIHMNVESRVLRMVMATFWSVGDDGPRRQRSGSGGSLGPSRASGESRPREQSARPRPQGASRPAAFEVVRGRRL